ncbi:MAG: hypothetical protein JNG85_03685 [Spirochaetaceae bacterium]|nr:hypothetical protein [Spirochaetaceae bacterium]
MRRTFFGLAIFLVLAGLPAAAAAESSPGFTARVGIGTDINLGLAVGGGAGFVVEFAGLPPAEFGVDLYYYHGTETSQEQVGPSLNTYHDTSTLVVYAVTANFLHSYAPRTRGFHYLTGFGVGAVSVDWIHTSTDDPSYNDSGDYTGAGLLVNLGLSYAFGSGFELRLQAPILVFDGPLDTVGFAPMLNAAAVLRF